MVFLQSLSVHVISSVPQGSVLHALLFLIGIAELPLSPESKLVMYADDILLHRPIIGKHLTINICSRMLKHLENGLTITICHLILQN